MEKNNSNKKVITELKISEGHVTANASQIMEEIKTFYANLYTSSHKATNKTFLEFTKNIDLQIPKLSKEENDECEGKLTLEECRIALKSMGNGKSPGNDGFTVEFYKCFFEFLDQDLLHNIEEL